MRHFQAAAHRLSSDALALPPVCIDPDARVEDHLARHAGFISPAHRATLAAMHLAVVGCGGLGSIMAESLARIGVGRLTLVGDTLDASNLNRWQGATLSDVGRPKASLLAERLRAMAPHVRIRAVTRPLDHPRSVLAMTAADAIVAGVDNDRARYLLNHLALQYLQPYFDAGANPAVQAERTAAGYVIDRPDLPAPSAYVLNQRTAALAVQELLNHVTAWRPTATFAGESWSAGELKRADRHNYPERPAECCPLCSLRIGRGSGVRLPGVTGTAAWSAGHGFDPA